ncbi:hypothetical protein [Coxiella endosymbiont of Ornithodoros amblus]|nr:hypothetical protein [Coxiella endosymbiont of Ornithodoros amblus]
MAAEKKQLLTPHEFDVLDEKARQALDQRLKLPSLSSALGTLLKINSVIL